MKRRTVFDYTPDMDRLNRLFWLFCLKMRDQTNSLEEIVGKLRKLMDCEDVRCNTRAVIIDEAHLIVEWQVFNKQDDFVNRVTAL